MKRYSLLLTVAFMLGIISACNNGSGSSDSGYVDPDIGTLKTVNSQKSYTLTGDSCGTSQNCNAIIYTGKLNGTKYVGIAADNRDTDVPPTYVFKLYWIASSIPEGTGLTLPSCTIKINSTSVTNTDVTNVDITNNGDGTYTVFFGDTIGSLITAGNNIRAYKYP